MPSPEHKRPVSPDGHYSEWLPHPGSGSDYAYVNAFTEVQRNGLWEYVGNSPYLEATGDENEVKTKLDGADCGDFGFETINRSVETILTVMLEIGCYQEGSGETITPYLYDGDTWHQLTTKEFPSGLEQSLSWDVTSILDTWTKINAAKLHFVYGKSGKADYAHVDAADIWVEWASGTHYDKVDDPVGSPDDDTTRVDTPFNTNWVRDLYNLESFTLPENNKIDKVVLFFRARGAGIELQVHSPIIKHLIRTHGTDYEYDGLELTSNQYVEHTHELAANPNTGQAWTGDEVNALQAGIKGQSKEFEYLGETWWNTARCTQVYIIIYYSPITQAAAKIQSGDGLVCVSVG